MAKKRKRTRRAKGAATTAAPFAFARTPPRSKHAKRNPATDPDGWQKYVRQRAARADRLATKRQMVERLLLQRGVYPEIAYKVAYEIDPALFYIVRIYGYKGSEFSDPLLAGEIGDEPVLQATFVGSGESCWQRIIAYASRAPIEHVEIDEIDPEAASRPLWDKYSIVTVDGDRIYGHGNLTEWRSRRKIGRPMKGGGGLTAKERRRRNKNKQQRLKRQIATEERASKLNKEDRKRLLKRSKERRKK